MLHLPLLPLVLHVYHHLGQPVPLVIVDHQHERPSLVVIPSLHLHVLVPESVIPVPQILVALALCNLSQPAPGLQAYCLPVYLSAYPALLMRIISRLSSDRDQQQLFTHMCINPFMLGLKSLMRPPGGQN